jgi:hypothetical protein
VNTVREDVDAYLEYHRELRSPNSHRDNSYVLRAWASDIDCGSVQEIDAAKLQAWFYRKARTTKIATAAAYLFAVRHFLLRSAMAIDTKNRQKQTAETCKQHLREKYRDRLSLVEEFIVEFEGAGKESDLGCQQHACRNLL